MALQKLSLVSGMITINQSDSSDEELEFKFLIKYILVVAVIFGYGWYKLRFN